MDLGIKNRTAVVAASSKGLGKASALALAQEGARICVCARSAEQVDATVDEIRATTGAQAMGVTVDLTSAEGIEEIFERTRSELGPVDILVVNAGGPSLGNFDQLTDGDWSAAFELVNLSAIRLIRAALADMRLRSWGRIVAIQSSSVKQPVENLMLSNGLRPGVAGMLKTLMADVATQNITINTVLPGAILTERIMNAQATRAREQGRTYEEQIEFFAQRIPMRRFGEPADVGAMVAFLASEPARYITGGVFQVDGGMIQSVV